MAAMVCPFCKSYASFVSESRVDPPPFVSGLVRSAVDFLSILKCSNDRCGMRVVALTDRQNQIHKTWPEHVGGKEFPDVPEHIAAAANEAHMCLGIGAYRASVAMSRAVVEATAKGHQVTTGNLRAKIVELAERGIISPAMREAADEVRFAGNEVAHGDLAEEPLGKDDAEEILGLMDAILLRVYQEPKQVERLRARRTSRSTGSS